MSPGSRLQNRMRWCFSGARRRSLPARVCAHSSATTGFSFPDGRQLDRCDGTNSWLCLTHTHTHTVGACQHLGLSDSTGQNWGSSALLSPMRLPDSFRGLAALGRVPHPLLVLYSSHTRIFRLFLISPGLKCQKLSCVTKQI